MTTTNSHFNRFVMAAGFFVALVAVVAAIGLLSTDQILAQAGEPARAEPSQLQTSPPPPLPSSPLVQTPEPIQHVERATMSTRGRAPDGPRLHVTTSGAAGTPATFHLPTSSGMGQVGIAAIQSPNDWTADFEEGFESGIGPSWQVFDLSNDGFTRTWGADDFYANSGSQSAWVAAAGTDAVDPEWDYYPNDLDSWLVTNGCFDLSNVQMADVEFYMYVDTEPEYDWIFVGASVDGQYFYGEYWTGDSGGWQYFDLDLSEFIGYSEVYLAWYFHSDETNDGVDYEGVWLDDITVWTYVDTGPPVGSESVQNGDFETGNLTGWTVLSGTADVTEATNPVTGTYIAFLGGNA